MARPREAVGLQDADLPEGRLGPIERFGVSSKWIAVAVFGDVAQVNGGGVQTCRTLVDRGCSALCIIRSSLHAATNCGEGRHDKQVVVPHGYQTPRITPMPWARLHAAFVMKYTITPAGLRPRVGPQPR